MTVATLGAPAASSADVLTEYQALAERRLSPAPLVPTAVPRSVAPLERTISPSPSRRRSGYGLRVVNGAQTAVVVLEGGSFKNMKAALRDGKRLSFKAKRTRVRGHRGYLFTRHVGSTQWLLVWVEDGRVYTLGTGTPRKVSLKQLRATAADLEHLGRYYIGAPDDPDNSSYGDAVTTDHAVTARVSWQAQCVLPGGSSTEIRVGNARVTMLPFHANAFTFDIAQNRDGTAPWSGTVSGTISPTAITLTIHATGTIDGMACDSGQLSFDLRP
jgi:hypothetical protein